uniref:Incw1 n=1 Tax=Arundo donax TaxID=35708 RepID=A0A0A8ZI68_ARUDO
MASYGTTSCGLTQCQAISSIGLPLSRP